MNKKNIDNLFQEKFRDFEEIPDEKVWNAIEASLGKKKKRRIVPIWWTLGGTAAALIIALLAFNPFSTGDVKPSVITDTQKNKNSKNGPNKNTNEFILDEVDDVDEVVVDKSNTIPSITTVSESKKNITEDRSSGNSNTNTSQNTINKSHNNGSFTANQYQVNEKAEKVVENQNTTKHPDLVDYTSNTQKEESMTSAANAQVNKDANILTKDNSSNSSAHIALNENSAAPFKTDLENKENSISETEVVDNTVEIQKNEDEKKSIFDEIEKEKEMVTTEKSDRWSAGPNIAPVYYNAVGEGSPVNSIFNENSKSGNTNLSYGLTVAYAINDKLSVRSGLNKVDYGYDTNDVGFSSTLQEASSEKIQNIDYASTAKNIVVTGQNSFNSLKNSDATYALEVSKTSGSERTGTMAQQFGYLEVPLELDYALIDRKFGLNILGGVSSLFLIDNSVSLTSDNLTTELGEANNVNSVNFSTNIGFGVNYKFTPKIRFNVEPVFKYQLNTFSDVSGDFTPFSIGVYSGLNFKF
ncbi:PorT family protein [Zobellia sp.]|nr:PorT family protein [Zobellia sp.]